MIDMHTHSQSSHDSTCPIEDMAKSAMDKGISVLAITDHIDIQYFDTVDNDAIARSSHLEVDKAREKMGDAIKLIKGLEMGEAFWFPDEEKRFLADHPADAVIGSVHAVKYIRRTQPFSTLDFSALSESEVYDYLGCYFADYEKMAGTTEIDIASHLTCPLYYTNKKHGKKIDIHRFDDRIERILRVLIDREIALEINSHCINNLGEFLPGGDIIKMYRDLGGELITTGSDAHTAECAGEGFDRLYALLGNIGFKNVYYYESRVPVRRTLKGENK